MPKTKIIYKLAYDLLNIWRCVLTQATFNRDHLVVQILLTLSQKLYVNELLFRDFNLDNAEAWYRWKVPQTNANGTVEYEVKRIHKQSLVYLEMVLMRRLTLANNLEALPTNMHVLYEALCQYGMPKCTWEQVKLRRDKYRVQNCEDNLLFQSIAKQLASQCQKLGDHFSEISQRRRDQYGPLWLWLVDCVAEVPEELTLLFDVLDALPVPLESSFANKTLHNRLNRVLEALNERYMLLRSCGLDPETWSDYHTLSINNLKDMKQLRKAALHKLTTGEAHHLEAAYQSAFQQLQDKQKKFAGCHHFKEFADSEWGRVMLNYLPISLNSSYDEDDEETLQDKLADSNEHSILEQLDARELRRMLIKTCPEQFGDDQVLIYFFCEILGFYQNFPPAGSEFKQLIATDPKYAQLSDQELLQVLGQKVDEITNRCLKRVKQRLREQQQR